MKKGDRSAASSERPLDLKFVARSFQLSGDNIQYANELLVKLFPAARVLLCSLTAALFSPSCFGLLSPRLLAGPP